MSYKKRPSNPVRWFLGLVSLRGGELLVKKVGKNVVFDGVVGDSSDEVQVFELFEGPLGMLGGSIGPFVQLAGPCWGQSCQNDHFVQIGVCLL